MIEIGKVISSKPGNIIVLLDSIEVFERNKDRLRISRYVSIEDGNNANILASIRCSSTISQCRHNQLYGDLFAYWVLF